MHDQRDRVNEQLSAERLNAQNVATKLAEENTRLKGEQQKDLETIAALEGKSRSLVSAMEAGQKELANLRVEVEGLRTQITEARNARDAKEKDVVRLTDELHNAVNELATLKKRSLELAEEFAKARDAANYSGVNYHSDFRAKEPPPWFDGVVLATQGQNMVEISGGSDMGLLKGHKLEVVRGGNKYLGRVEVITVSPDRAVCQVDPKMPMATQPQRGDRVYAKLK
ncbi:MAG: hypothetical protein ABSG68_05500 [Thermoguttaceae bacterium]